MSVAKPSLNDILNERLDIIDRVETERIYKKTYFKSPKESEISTQLNTCRGQQVKKNQDIEVVITDENSLDQSNDRPRLSAAFNVLGINKRNFHFNKDSSSCIKSMGPN